MSCTPPNLSCDVLVIGSGAGGLAAAVTAAYHGMKVIVAEKDAVMGGATSWSGGWAWTPGTHFAKRDGLIEDPEQFRTYLRSVIGRYYQSDNIDAFIEAAPRMVEFFEKKTQLQWTPGAKIKDIYGNLPEAGTGHRSVGPKPWNARNIDPNLLKKLRHQKYETSFLGMGIMAGPDLSQFLAASQFSPQGWLHSAKRVLPHMWDLLAHRRNMQLVNGTALIGRLAQSGADLGVEYLVNTEGLMLMTEDGRINGAKLRGPDGEFTIEAGSGVVLATGGFPRNVELRKELFPGTPSGHEHHTLAPETCTGDGLRLAQSVGAAFAKNVASPAAWCPVSLVPYANGTTGIFPHIMDRAKPGSIGVLRNGKRFVNEANGYYDYVDAMFKTVPEGEAVQSWQIADSRFVRKYPLGMAKPRPIPLTPYLRSGYLIRAKTLEELAQKCGIDPVNLDETVGAFNRAARRGEDPEFHRGKTEFNRYGGDPKVQPNPSLAPIEKGPFYAVKVVPGSFGTFDGIAADGRGKVLDEDGADIPGLYTAGNDRASIMGGFYPAGGTNLGPALTFGYVVGRELSGASDYEVTAAESEL
ncbi:FAD-dependent oxidoreductase [Rothia uropygialis]|uniref:FAD-dependent oxidoreductase n=1 Tax=Kocuria sp. 36 TaxID=1415402 RepID=UPI00101E01EE|nr:FAD-dependent oxidoreductase [Kocuria sp. 36]